MKTGGRSVKLNSLWRDEIGDNHGVGNEPDLFGIEIELEGRNIVSTNPEITTFWTRVNDGSLRINKLNAQAIEYVFKRPRNLEVTTLAIRNLFDYLNSGPPVEVFDSYRTSIHVHINCLGETVKTICNFITLAIIFDELFVSQNGETRIGNNFCLRAKDAEGQIETLSKCIRHFGTFTHLNPQLRYSSVNTSSLTKFGTIEFRSLECTTDFERVMHWIKTLQALKESARQYENPMEIISQFSVKGPLRFMIHNLGGQWEKYANVSGSQRMLAHGMRLAQDFAYCSDWRQATEAEMAGPKVNKLKAFDMIEPGMAIPVGWPGPNDLPHWANNVLAHVAPQNEVEFIVEDDGDDVEVEEDFDIMEDDDIEP